MRDIHLDFLKKCMQDPRDMRDMRKRFGFLHSCDPCERRDMRDIHFDFLKNISVYGKITPFTVY